MPKKFIVPGTLKRSIFKLYCSFSESSKRRLNDKIYSTPVFNILDEIIYFRVKKLLKFQIELL